MRLAPGPIVVASHNPGKAREIVELLGPFGFEVKSAAELGLPEPEETGTTFAENAELKARAGAAASGLRALADDSGLAVDALDGAPGIYSARWAGPSKDFDAAMRMVEAKLQALGATTPEKRRAHFVCALSLGHPDGTVETFEGRVDGTLVWPPRGITRLRLRPGVPAGRAYADVRRDERGGKARLDGGRRRAAVAPGKGVPVVRGSEAQARMNEGENLSAGIPASATAFGIYVHWPFCAAKCPYCDFNSHVRHAPPDEARFADAFARELKHFAALTPGRTVTSIFLGGGTPSLMKPQTVQSVLDAIAALWPVAPDAEVTLEANPGSVEAERFRGYRAAGVNRLSLGVQSLHDDGAEEPRAHPQRGRGARRHRAGAQDVSAPLLRPDLCAARPDRSTPGGRSFRRRSASLPTTSRSTS